MPIAVSVRRPHVSSNLTPADKCVHRKLAPSIREVQPERPFRGVAWLFSERSKVSWKNEPRPVIGRGCRFKAKILESAEVPSRNLASISISGYAAMPSEVCRPWHEDKGENGYGSDVAQSGTQTDYEHWPGEPTWESSRCPMAVIQS